MALTAPLSIYIHIPFCGTKCTYCAFNTYVNLDNLIEPFVQALVKELAIVGGNPPGQGVGTIYLGGGTPSLLTPEQFARILAAVHDHFVVLPDAEISLEANPNDLSRDYLAVLRSAGATRLSIGMQSAVDSELTMFHRRHDHPMVIRAVEAARAAGFDNLNLDIIYGIPQQTLAYWETTLRQTLALDPEHISLYALGLEDGTLLKTWVEDGFLPVPDDDLAADMYDLATEMLGAAGYEQYEISNWSQPGYACRHNLQYWYNLPYVGLGPGAHGFAGGVRYSTVLLPQKYIRLIQDSDESYTFPYTPATAEAVVVDRANEIAETLIMGLRLTREGIRRATFARRFGVDVLELHGATFHKYENYGLLYIDNDVVRLTQKGRLLSNVIFRELV
jgi:oxygen-independent coproporphyrinogen-3 oxidase